MANRSQNDRGGSRTSASRSRRSGDEARSEGDALAESFYRQLTKAARRLAGEDDEDLARTGRRIWHFLGFNRRRLGNIFQSVSKEARLTLADEARKNRPSQAEVEGRLPPSPEMGDVSPEYQELMTKLRAAVAERPDELQGQQLLARNEAALGNFVAAHQAQAKVVELKGDQVRAGDLTDLADMMILSAGGFVSPEAERVLMRALELDPRNAVARYYMGLMFAQVGTFVQSLLYRPACKK